MKVSAGTSYGPRWMITDAKGLRKIEHAGNTFGFTSGLAFLPDKGLGVVVLTNARASNVFNEAVIRRVIDPAFGQDTAEGAADFHFVLKRTADDDSVRYLAADPPLAGPPLSSTEDAGGAPTVTPVSPPDRYVFERVRPIAW